MLIHRGLSRAVPPYKRHKTNWYSWNLLHLYYCVLALAEGRLESAWHEINMSTLGEEGIVPMLVAEQ